MIQEDFGSAGEHRYRSMKTRGCRSVGEVSEETSDLVAMGGSGGLLMMLGIAGGRVNSLGQSGSSQNHVFPRANMKRRV